jgi:hypothetical protein
MLGSNWGHNVVIYFVNTWECSFGKFLLFCSFVNFNFSKSDVFK